MTRLAASLASLLVVASLATADAPAVPRYTFEPGQEMTYRTTSTLKYGEDRAARERVSRTDWTVWVAAANKDGSFRLVVRVEDRTYYDAGGKKLERPGLTQLVYADVFQDGRLL